MNSRISAISLQTKLVSCILLISLVLVGFSVMLLQQARGDYASMERIEAIHHCDDRLILAIENLAFERGRTNVILAANQPVDLPNLAFIQSRRQLADAEIAASLKMLAEIEPIGLMEAIRRKMFAEISRQPDGGKGAAGVISKNDDYYNPFLDLMQGGASHEIATNAN